MAISVVLHGDLNDKSALQAAVRYAAREGTLVRLVLGQGCSETEMEKHLHFCRWDVETRLGLPAPEFIVERYGEQGESAGFTADTHTAAAAPSGPWFTQRLRSFQALFRLPTDDGQRSSRA